MRRVGQRRPRVASPRRTNLLPCRCCRRTRLRRDPLDRVVAVLDVRGLEVDEVPLAFGGVPAADVLDDERVPGLIAAVMGDGPRCEPNVDSLLYGVREMIAGTLAWMSGRMMSARNVMPSRVCISTLRSIRSEGSLTPPMLTATYYPPPAASGAVGSLSDGRPSRARYSSTNIG